MKKKIITLLVILIMAMATVAFVACDDTAGGGGGGGETPRLGTPTNVTFSVATGGRHYINWTPATPAPPTIEVLGIDFRIYADGEFVTQTTASRYNIGSTVFAGTDPVEFTIVANPRITTHFQSSLPSAPATLTRTPLAAPTGIRTLTTNLTWTNPSTPALGNWPTRIYADGEFVLEHTGSIFPIASLGLPAGTHSITVALAARGPHLQSPQSIAYNLTIA
ncbi:MAG: hypothetical protein FWC80_01560 [Firmicutes bacterium]|nr:hypothetical protein [Bacillota bacterium]